MSFRQKDVLSFFFSRMFSVTHCVKIALMFLRLTPRPGTFRRAAFHLFIFRTFLRLWAEESFFCSKRRLFFLHCISFSPSERWLRLIPGICMLHVLFWAKRTFIPSHYSTYFHCVSEWKDLGKYDMLFNAWPASALREKAEPWEWLLLACFCSNRLESNLSSSLFVPEVFPSPQTSSRPSRLYEQFLQIVLISARHLLRNRFSFHAINSLAREVRLLFGDSGHSVRHVYGDQRKWNRKRSIELTFIMSVIFKDWIKVHMLKWIWE